MKTDHAGRRGFGIELAILALVVIFGMSTLLVSTALLERSHLQQQKTILAQHMELEQLAEEFCASADKVHWQPGNSAYTASVSSDGCTLILMQEDAPMLTVILTYESGTYTVAQWIYH